MNLASCYLIVAVSATLMATTDAGESSYNVTVSYQKLPIQSSNVVRIECKASRSPYWIASDRVVWEKKQPPETQFVRIAESSSILFPGIRVTLTQGSPDTVTSTLIIEAFRPEDYGVYRCGAQSSNTTWSSEVFLQQDNTNASVKILVTAPLKGDTYEYSARLTNQSTSCTGKFIGGPSKIYMQVLHGAEDVTELFSNFTNERLVGNYSGLKVLTRHVVLNSSFFTAASKEVTSLMCTALLNDTLPIASDVVKIRAAAGRPPSISCLYQEPSKVRIGTEGAVMTCAISDYNWTASSVVKWTYAAPVANSKTVVRETLSDNEKNSIMQAVQNPLFPQLKIFLVTNNILNNPIFNVTLFENLTMVTSTSFKLKAEDPIVVKPPKSGGTTGITDTHHVFRIIVIVASLCLFKVA